MRTTKDMSTEGRGNRIVNPVAHARGKCGIQGQSRHIDSAISYRKVVTNQIGSIEGGDGRRHVEGTVEVLEDGTRQGASMHSAARDADGFFGTHTPVSWTWHFRPNANFCQIHRFHP
jgi:hypothetical protein